MCQVGTAVSHIGYGVCAVAEVDSHDGAFPAELGIAAGAVDDFLVSGQDGFPKHLLSTCPREPLCHGLLPRLLQRFHSCSRGTLAAGMATGAICHNGQHGLVGFPAGFVVLLRIAVADKRDRGVVLGVVFGRQDINDDDAGVVLIGNVEQAELVHEQLTYLGRCGRTYLRAVEQVFPPGLYQR